MKALALKTTDGTMKVEDIGGDVTITMDNGFSENVALTLQGEDINEVADILAEIAEVKTDRRFSFVDTVLGAEVVVVAEFNGGDALYTVWLKADDKWGCAKLMTIEQFAKIVEFFEDSRIPA